MRIENLTSENLESALDIYQSARAFMRRIGNGNQWKDSWPPQEVLEGDIAAERLFGVFEETELTGVFAFWYGRNAEPSYHTVYGGHWMSETPYGVVHRIAAKEGSGAGQAALLWAVGQSNGHLRIDTHRDNAAMRHVLEKLGFSERGVILLENGEERIAYEIVR